MAQDPIPSDGEIQRWASEALTDQATVAELTVRIVNESESAHLNETYCNKSGSTNVLSFTFQCPPEVDLPLLGDVVVCAPVVAREAKAQNKQPFAHWAHMVIHGTLHLLGHDHADAEQAQTMEDLEIAILEKLGYPNPYVVTESYEQRRSIELFK